MKKNQLDFKQINKWRDQRPGKQQPKDSPILEIEVGQVPKEVNNKLASLDLFLQALDAANLDGATEEDVAWLKDFAEKIKVGTRQQKGGIESVNEFTQGIVIPDYLIHRINDFLGLKREGSITDSTGMFSKDPGPFKVEDVSKALECSPEQAIEMITFTILATTSHDIKTVIEHQDWDWVKKATEDIKKIREIFPSSERVDQLVDIALRKAMPIIQEHSSVAGINSIIGRIKFRALDHTKKFLQIKLATPDRQKEYYAAFRTLDIKDALVMLESYEYLFGQMPAAEFQYIFNAWHTAESCYYGKYKRRYNLKLPASTSEAEPQSRTAESLPEPQPDTDSNDREGDRESDESGEENLPEQDIETPTKPSAVKKVFRRAVLALAFVTALGAATKLRCPSESKAPDDNRPDEAADFMSGHVPSLEQRSETRVSNFAPEVEHERQNSVDFVSSPHFNGMLATEVFTEFQAKPGRLCLDPDLDFDIDEAAINPENSNTYTVARRIYDQGVILYPPEMGKVDINSIYIEDYSADEYTITPGELGRYLVKLNETPKEPFIIIYKMAKLKPGIAPPYSGEVPALPTSEYELENASMFELEPYPSEDDYSFAIRAESTIRNAYVYPTTTEDKGLSFNEATDLLIGDCDVANTHLMQILTYNGIKAEMITDVHPVPNNEKHGQLRALVHSDKHGGYVIVSLNATPSSPFNFTESSSASTQKESLLIELEESLENYQQNRGENSEAGTQEANPVKAVAATKKIKIYPEVSPEQELSLSLVSPDEWNALGRGIYGYSEYLLDQAKLLPDNKSARIRAITKLMVNLMEDLQNNGAIPAGVDPYKWSEHINEPEALKLTAYVNNSFSAAELRAAVMNE